MLLYKKIVIKIVLLYHFFLALANIRYPTARLLVRHLLQTLPRHQTLLIFSSLSLTPCELCVREDRTPHIQACADPRLAHALHDPCQNSPGLRHQLHKTVICCEASKRQKTPSCLVSDFRSIGTMNLP